MIPFLYDVNAYVWIQTKFEKKGRYRYYIYSEDYGQEYENLVGKSYSEELTDSELERMTEECLTENPYITGIENFSCIKQEEKITLTFRLITEA